MVKKKTISAVVAAYNEEANIANVLSELVKYKGFKEIVVVDDGSSDNTFEEICKFPVKAVQLPKNLGKSEAVKVGLDEAAGVDVIFLCDADIIGFKVEYAEDIIEPVITGRLNMHMGQRSKFSPLVDKLLSLIRTQWISGERAIDADILKLASQDPRFKGFMMETVINAYVKRMGRKAGITRYNYRNPYKTEKNGFWQGVRVYAPFAIAMIVAFLLLNYFLPDSKLRLKKENQR